MRLACARAISSCGFGSERTKSITGLLSEPSSSPSALPPAPLCSLRFPLRSLLVVRCLVVGCLPFPLCSLLPWLAVISVGGCPLRFSASTIDSFVPAHFTLAPRVMQSMSRQPGTLHSTNYICLSQSSVLCLPSSFQRFSFQLFTFH